MLFLVAVAVAGPTGRLSAFKMETHVWIAQQVINDALPDGRVTIEPFGEFEVPEHILDALRARSSRYRMGHVGPDAFPDLISGQATAHPGVSGGWSSDGWLRWVFNGARSPGQLAFALGYLSHAAADVFAHTYVNLYAGGAWDLDIAGIAENDFEVELRHSILEEYIAARQPPMRDNQGRAIAPADAVATPLRFVRNRLILNGAVAQQYRKKPVTTHLALMFDYWSKLNAAVQDIEEMSADVSRALADIQREINNLLAEINRIKNATVSIFGATVKIWPAYCFFDPGTCLFVLSNEATLLLTRETLALGNHIQQRLVDSALNPVKKWRDDVGDAVLEYVRTSQRVAIEMLKRDGGDPMAPIEDWVCRYLPAFMAVPSEISVGFCEVSEVLDSLLNVHGKLEELLGEDFEFFAWLIDPIGKLQHELTQVIQDEFEELAFDLVEAIIGDDSGIVDLLGYRRSRTLPVITEQLAETFRRDESGRGLLEFTNPNVVQRVNADMYLAGGHWDPERFAPVHNAVVLCKLLLLQPHQLNLLMQRAGVGATAYGPRLYPVTMLPFNVGFATNRNFNMILGAFRSLDGNHQWQEHGIPYPRRPGFQSEQGSHGLPFSVQNGTGFRIWQDCEARTRVFHSIFLGPLAPALEDPEIVGLTPILGENDPNRSSPDDPFPLAPGSSLPAKLVTEDELIEVDRTQVAVLDGGATLCGADFPGNPIYSWWFLDDCSAELRLVSSDRRVTTYLCVPRPCASGATYFEPFEVTHANVPLPQPIPTSLLEALTRAIRERAPIDFVGITSLSTQPADSSVRFDFPTRGEAVGECITVGHRVLCENRGMTRSFNGNLLCARLGIRTLCVKGQSDPLNILVETIGLDSGKQQRRLRLHGPEDPLFDNWEDVALRVRETLGVPLCELRAPPPVREFVIPPDEEPPVILAPPDIVVECTSSAGEEVELGEPVASDDRDPEVEIRVQGNRARFPRGTTVVTWIAIDDAGNTSRAEQRVTVEDTTPPVIDPVAPEIRVMQQDSGLAVVSLPAPAARDDCSAPVVVSREPRDDVFPVGETLVTWTARDAAGNIASVEQTVIVEWLRGDLDTDGDVDLDDVEIVLTSIGDPIIVPEIELEDFNGDGEIDDADREILATLREQLSAWRDPRDIDGDGAITEADAAALRELCSEPNCGVVEPLFRRGDCNDDAVVDISDVIALLDSLFSGKGELTCEDACDSNDDGDVDISDGIATLGVLFLGTGTIPAPGISSCGVDPTGDAIGCDRHARCPN